MTIGRPLRTDYQLTQPREATTLLLLLLVCTRTLLPLLLLLLWLHQTLITTGLGGWGILLVRTAGERLEEDSRATGCGTRGRISATAWSRVAPVTHDDSTIAIAVVLTVALERQVSPLGE